MSKSIEYLIVELNCAPDLKKVEAEVRHQVRRLQHHPSIALWAANNENAAALRLLSRICRLVQYLTHFNIEYE